MRILVYGAGVIGSIFAGKLALAGNDVTVLARSQRFEEIARNGILLVNPKSNVREQADVRVIDTLMSDDSYDVIFVAMQRTQVEAILPVLSSNLSPIILFLVNTAGGYKAWAKAVGSERLMLGFPSAGGERKDGAVQYFIGDGLKRVFQTTTFGEYSGIQTERLNTILQLFRGAKIPAVFTRNMDAWQKTHVAMVTNIANALYGFDCDNRALGRSLPDVLWMVKGIQEGRKVLRKNHIAPTPAKLFWLDFPVPLLTLGFALFMQTKLAEITMARHCAVAKAEMICLQQEFDVWIEKSGLNTPAIDHLRHNLYSESR